VPVLHWSASDVLIGNRGPVQRVTTSEDIGTPYPTLSEFITSFTSVNN
jgi:hypothetical protein